MPKRHRLPDTAWRRRKLEPRYSFICDSGYTGEVHLTADTWLSLVRIPRDTLTKLVPRAERLCRSVRSTTMTSRGVCCLATSARLLDVRWNNDGRAMHLSGEHILDLIALALGAQGDARKLAQERGACAVRRAAILREIERRSGDPGLQSRSRNIARRHAAVRAPAPGADRTQLHTPRAGAASGKSERAVARSAMASSQDRGHRCRSGFYRSVLFQSRFPSPSGRHAIGYPRCGKTRRRAFALVKRAACLERKLRWSPALCSENLRTALASAI